MPNAVVKLHEIPRKSQLKVYLATGKWEIGIFDHIDGMYSYCYLKKDPSVVFHLSAMTPLRKVGDWYEIVSQADLV